MNSQSEQVKLRLVNMLYVQIDSHFFHSYVVKVEFESVFFAWFFGVK